MTDIATQNIQAKKAQNGLFHPLKVNNFELRLLDLQKIVFQSDGEIKLFRDKETFMAIKPTLQKILKDVPDGDSEATSAKGPLK